MCPLLPSPLKTPAKMHIGTWKFLHPLRTKSKKEGPPKNYHFNTHVSRCLFFRLLFFVFLLVFMSDHKPFYLIQWNARSVRNKLHHLRDPLFTNSSVLTIQESFLKAPHNFSSPGKVSFRQDRSWGSRGGLMTAVCRDFPASTRTLQLPSS